MRNAFRRSAGLTAATLLIAAWPALALPQTSSPNTRAALLGIADRVLAWRTDEDVDLHLTKGLEIKRFARFSQAEEGAYAQKARTFVAELGALPVDGLSDAEQEFRLTLMRDLSTRGYAGDDYWHDFAVTPYRGGDIHQAAALAFARAEIGTAAQRQAYLDMIHAYGQALAGMRLKTLAQAERGIRLPKPALPQAIAIIDGIADNPTGRIDASDPRLTKLAPADAAAFVAAVEKRLQESILPAQKALRATFDAAYQNAAPTDVGLRQYPGGLDRYRRCIRDEIGLDLTPETIHRIGIEAGQDYDRRLSALRERIGFKGDRAAFQRAVVADPRWIASSSDEVASRYEAYMRKIEPIIPRFFSRLPKAGYGVRRLDPSSEGGQTYGVYQPPSTREPKGYYRFNGSNLADRSTIGAQHLIYHELMPGHHLQIALQRERPAFHELEGSMLSDAFIEGWAEYAAWLGEEAGLYEPYEMIGHLQLQSFLASRLVADTGMNALGWPLEKARDYMRRNSGESDRQIASETLRYSTDIPCQALSYYLGYDSFRKARQKAQTALGKNFDIRRYHDFMLSGGSIPIALIERRADRFIQSEREAPVTGEGKE